MKRLISLLCISFKLIAATSVTQYVIPFIDQVMPAVQQELQEYQNPLFFTDIDEVLLIKNEKKQFLPVEGEKTQKFFKVLNTLVADRKQHKELTNNPCFGLTARHYEYSQTTEKQLANAGFTFNSVFNEKDYSKASIGISIGVPLEVQEKTNDPKLSKEEKDALRQAVEDKRDGTTDTIGFYNGVVYASHINKKKALADFLNKLKEHGPDPDYIFFIDDQKRNIDDVASLFTEPDIKKLAAEIDVKEDLIIGLRVSVKKVVLVHYTYDHDKRTIQKTFIRDINRYCQDKQLEAIADFVDELLIDDSDLIDKENQLLLYKNNLETFKTIMTAVILGDYKNKHEALYGPLPALVLQGVQETIDFFDEYIENVDQLLKEITIYKKKITEKDDRDDA